MDSLTELVGTQTQPRAVHRSEGRVELFAARIAEGDAEP